MKKAIIITLAAVGGVTLLAGAIAGIATAIQVAKDTKRFKEMSPEERDAENRRVSEFLESLYTAEMLRKTETANADEETNNMETVN